MSFTERCWRCLPIIKVTIGIFLCVLSATTAPSCTDNQLVVSSGVGNINPSLNTPVTTNALNAFAFTVDAQQFSLHRVERLTFTLDSLAYTLVVTGYTSGGGALTLSDGRGEVMRTDTLNFNHVIASTAVVGRIPAEVTVTLTSFSGNIAFALAGVRRGTHG
jgi:hypothetical protein